MHERALMDDLLREIEDTARNEGARRVTRIDVRLGALSHFTAAHFREHFIVAATGTLAEGAEVRAEEGSDPTAPQAQGVVLESMELEW